MFSWYADANKVFYGSNYKEYSIVADDYTRVAWNNRRQRGAIRYDMNQVKDQDIKNFGCDVFQILHDGEYEETFDGESWGSEVLETFMNNDEVELLMNSCCGDADFSAFSTGNVLKKVHEELTNVKNLYLEKNDLQDKIDNESDEQKKSEYEDKLFDIDMKYDSAISYTKSKISSAALEALDGLGELSKMKAMGLLPDVADDSDPEQSQKRFDVIQNIMQNDYFKKMMQMAGRCLNLGDTALSETTDTPEEFIGLTTGNEIDGIQLEDLALLGNKDLELLFWADYADENLIIDLYQGTKTKGFGDIILLTDISPSMNCDLGSFQNSVITRHQVTRAFAYAMHSEAKDRTVVELPFNSRCTRTVTDRMESINLGVSGGTCFQRAFEKTQEVIPDLDNPDIIFITDGESGVYEETLQEITSKGVRIWLYTIGCSHNQTVYEYAHRAFMINGDIEKSIENLSEAMKATK